jgi:hypothetical protein
MSSTSFTPSAHSTLRVLQPPRPPHPAANWLPGEDGSGTKRDGR